MTRLAAGPSAEGTLSGIGFRRLHGVIGPKCLGLPPATLGTLMLPGVDLQIPPVKIIVATGEPLNVAFGATAGDDNVGEHV